MAMEGQAPVRTHRFHPSLLKFRNEVDGLRKRSEKNGQGSLLIDYLLSNQLLPRMESTALYPEVFSRDHDVIAARKLHTLNHAFDAANAAISTARSEGSRPPSARLMLGIESSYDDCSLAIVDLNGTVIRKAHRSAQTD